MIVSYISSQKLILHKTGMCRGKVDDGNGFIKIVMQIINNKKTTVDYCLIDDDIINYRFFRGRLLLFCGQI